MPLDQTWYLPGFFFLKDYATELADIISKLFQFSIDSGSIPDDWKRASIVPIFKLEAQGPFTAHLITNSKQFSQKKILAAFRGMHVSPVKHSFGKCDRRTDRQTDRRTDRQTDKVIPMCLYASQATQKDNQNERIQINACVVGNTSACCCEPLV